MKKKKINKNRNGSNSFSHGIIKGRLEITRSGMGYVIIEKDGSDVMVKPGDFNTALNGDLVRVKVTKQNPRTGKREGKITEVVTRRQTEFIGYLQLSTNHAFFIPDSDKPMPDLFIPLSSTMGAKHKDRVVARMVKWEREDKKPVGEVIGVLLPEDRNDAAMKELIAQNGFPLVFPDEVLEEAARLPEQISEEEINRRRDFRSILTFTIDPVDARDFDDALSIRFLSDGWWEVGVHIADVSHYIQPETVLDEEAYRRATSVYLPDRVNPMLPETISNELCSLRPHEDKLCFSVLFEIDNAANVVSSWIGRTAIHSNRRFTYEEAQQIIETGQGDFSSEVLQLHRLASIFRKKRFENGALRVEQTEVKFRIDDKGKPVSVFFKESKEANWLIEEFMLLANKYVAIFVGKKEQSQQAIKTFVYRIHDQPNDQKLAELKRFVSNFGYKLDLNNPRTISSSINKMLTDVKGKPEADMIENLTIRSMAKAIYSTENIGHYGLSFDYYSHFTSPIRRYPDVMAHRLLQRYMDGGSSVSKEEYDKKCRHSSDMEKRASDAERASIKYKQVEYLGERIGKTFSGVITGVTEWGVYVEILENKCEGMIRLRDMADDYYHFDEKNYCIRGTRTGNVYRLGDKVTINVKKTDLEKRTIDFEMVGLTEEK